MDKGRLFVLTCAHALPALSKTNVWIVKIEGSLQSKGFPAFVAIRKFPKERPDIALLELDPSHLDDYLKGRTPITRDELASMDGGMKPNHPLTVVGNLGNKVYYEKVGKGDVYGASIVCLLHKQTAPKDWPPLLAGDPQHDPRYDFYMDSIKRDDPGEKKRAIGYSDPTGLSGGSVWGFFDQGLWSSDNLKVVGIQSSWDSIHGFLHGIRIEAALELLDNPTM
jgi:hypothetical protein